MASLGQDQRLLAEGSENWSFPVSAHSWEDTEVRELSSNELPVPCRNLERGGHSEFPLQC